MPSSNAVLKTGVVSLFKRIVPSVSVALVRLLSWLCCNIGKPGLKPPLRWLGIKVLFGLCGLTFSPVSLSTHFSFDSLMLPLILALIALLSDSFLMSSNVSLLVLSVLFCALVPAITAPFK